MSHGTIRVARDGPIVRIALNRPQIRNAFNDEMISDLLEAFASLADDALARVVVLSGDGPAFCAGADLNWMRRVVAYTREESLEDSLRLARMLRAIHSCPKPVVARVHGAAIGGGTGLVAACDIAIAADSAVFAFSETKLGLIPAAISPYLMKRMGEAHLRRYFLTGERFTGVRAAEIGLVNASVPEADLDEAVEEQARAILSGGPCALAASKILIERVAEQTLDENGPYTAEAITDLRLSEEGQEGMNAFLEKRKARWVETGEEQE